MENETIPQKNTNTTRNIIMFLGTVILAGLLIVFGVSLNNAESSDLQGRTATDFSLPLFDQFEQDQITLSDQRGQVVVVNFWASWCVECYREAPLLEQAWRDFKDRGVVFIGVDHLDTEKEGLEYMKKYDITYPSGPDLGNEISKDYAITGVPETFFIDKNGNIAHIHLGPIEEDDLYRLLEQLIAKPYQGT
ncbi:MAG: TlpA disulfide reductase family protein [Chloroflexota bacterium]